MRITMTAFLSFIVKQGRPRVTSAKNIKHRYEEEKYHPRTDYWRILTTRIREAHEDGLGKEHLHTLIPTLHPNKQANYEQCIEQYISWWGKKKLESFAPPRAEWTAGPLTVIVNPDLGLRINGEATAIKLYFRTEPLTRRHIEAALHLMRTTLVGTPEDLRCAILDVRRKKLLIAGPLDQDMDLLLAAEAASLAVLWPRT